jgi:TatD DNase family protein
MLRYRQDAEAERRRRAVICAASSWNAEDFLYTEALAQKAAADNAPPIVLCCAVHPQVPAARTHNPYDLLSFVESMVQEKRLNALGETGFDLFNDAFRQTEAVQDELFAVQLEYAQTHSLPLVLHIRKALHKVFAASRQLKKVPAVVFHAWSGTATEGQALLRRGINAFFSFGSSITLNHKAAVRSCADLPAERLLLETDAPYQPLRGSRFSQWADLPLILHSAAHIRGESPQSLSLTLDDNFTRAYLL